MVKKKPLVLLTHPLFPEIVRRELGAVARIRIVRTRAGLLRALPEADGLVTLLDLRIDAPLLARAPRLRVVANVAVGVDNIDFAACKARGVRVCNTPNVLTRSTAELALTLLLAAARRVPEGQALCAGSRPWHWALDLLLGQELRGRSAVIVGPGRIGAETARLFRALGLRVKTIGRSTSSARVRAALKQAQVLSLHLPLTSETRHWLSASRIACLPRDAIVVNTSRGAVVDERALILALKSRRIFAAGLDVYEHEPRLPPSLRKLRNVVLLPHVGSATVAARQGMARLACQGVAGVLSGKRPPNELAF